MIRQMKNEGLISAYMSAKHDILENGFADEIDWQDEINYENVDESYFMKEAAWVILSSGMREKVVRNLFPQICAAFFNWESSKKIIDNQYSCRELALSVFNSSPKIDAIIDICSRVHHEGFTVVYNAVRDKGIPYIMEFPFMGPATSFHFAKNIGLPVAKPDRHLKRIAEQFGYKSPDILCSEIAETIGEKVSVVDLVFWRFATIHTDYLDQLWSNAILHR